MGLIRWSFLGLAVLGAGACAALGDFASDDPGLAAAPGAFAGRFLAVSDADMAGTAYADGALEPLAEEEDALILFDGGVPVASAAASNSVISWPQVVDVSDDGRFAFVVETRGQAPRDVEAYDDVYTAFPEGTWLGVFSIGEETLTLRDARAQLGSNLQSVEAARGQGYLIIASETPDAELITVGIGEDGAIGAVRTFDLDPEYLENDAERRIRTIHVAPDGVTLAANIANHRIQFYRLRLDADGQPNGVVKLGAQTDRIGSRIAVGKWTPDGRHFIITDTNWGDSTLHMLTQGPGALTVIAPPQTASDAPRLISRAEVGRSPEGFGISPDGEKIASINMERTYLPNWPFLSVWQGRRRYSVSLLSFDPATGMLEETDRIYKAGILPEDVIFDEDGENLAVAVFHRRKGEDRRRGFIDFFSIENGDALVSQGVTQPVIRGAHDLVRLP